MAQSRDASARKGAAIIAGMHRLEVQLRLLPAMFAIALGECNPRDKSESQAVVERVKEIRAEYLVALQRGNGSLHTLGLEQHDIEALEDYTVRPSLRL